MYPRIQAGKILDHPGLSTEAARRAWSLLDSLERGGASAAHRWDWKSPACEWAGGDWIWALTPGGTGAGAFGAQRGPRKSGGEAEDSEFLWAGAHSGSPK